MWSQIRWQTFDWRKKMAQIPLLPPSLSWHHRPATIVVGPDYGRAPPPKTRGNQAPFRRPPLPPAHDTPPLHHRCRPPHCRTLPSTSAATPDLLRRQLVPHGRLGFKPFLLNKIVCNAIINCYWCCCCLIVMRVIFVIDAIVKFY